MGRAPCCSKEGLQRGPWTSIEDQLLINYIHSNGVGHWRSLPEKAGLLRCGKSCRLRWMNYLRPDIKRGNMTSDEDDLIIRLHSLLGNRWSLIAGRLPGRTDNEIKNYWNSHLSKRFKKTSTNIDKSSPSFSSSSETNRPTNMIKKGNVGNNNYQETDQNTIKNKIHLPKAVRVSSSGVLFSKENHFHDHADDFFHGYVSSCQNYMPMTIPNDYNNNNNDMFDEIFKEYEQILEKDNVAYLDSFVDSLLA